MLHAILLPDPVTQDWFDTTSNYKNIINERSKKNEHVGPMLAKTRKLLDEFYEPHKRELAKLLNDDRFLWK